MGIKETKGQGATAPKREEFELDLGVKKNGRKTQQPVDNVLDRGAFEVNKTQRWIQEHSAPVVQTAERRAEILRALKAARVKVVGSKP